MTEKVFSCLNSVHYIGIMALDLKKAFNTVNHKILIDKLNYYGVQNKEKQWFEDHL